MMKIFTAAQIKALDKYTIENEPISSVNLMERASRSFVTWFTEHFNALNKVGIICGTGNNGGDGLAIARMLKDWGYQIKVWIVRGSVAETPDFKINFERIKEENIELYEISKESDQGLFEGRDILIDAIFGYGLSRPAEGVYAQAIKCINAANATRIAIDMPSGLMADHASSGEIILAHHTVSFQFPKLSFFFPEYHRFIGEWIVLDIGLDKRFIKEENTSNFQLDIKSVKRLFRKRSKFDHKGTFGHVLLIGGSYGKIGATVLSGRAVLRAGAGLLTVYIPQCGYNILQTAVPEAMVLTDHQQEYLSDAPEPDPFTVIGIGPGLGQHPDTVKMLRELMQKGLKRLVIDADGLNILAANREILHLLPEGSVLTPHPKEFERLVGVWKNDFERLEKQKKLAAQLKSVIVLKGAYTSIASPDGKVFFNSTGNPGMATGGTGDVLTGIISGILAQGYTSLEAAILGVYLHGLAGDLAVLEKGMESLVASDLVEFLPAAFRQIKR